MPTEVRFPSGATLRQVKKDAKTLKRELNIPHHEALNAAAKRHGLDLDWRDLQSRLDRGGEFVRLTFQCNVALALTWQRPAGFVIGPPGSGKSAIAAELCVNLLKASVPVVYLVYDFMRSYGTIPGFIADAMGSASANVPGFKAHTITTKETFADVLASIAPPPGALIVLEEPQALLDFDTASLCKACVKWQVGFMGVIQHPEAIRNVALDSISFTIDAVDLNREGTLSFQQTDSSARARLTRLKVIETYRYVFPTFAALIQRPE